MNKFLFFFFLFFAKLIIAQSPHQISYQGVARDNTGKALANTTLAVKFDIHQGSPSGSVVFSEQHEGTTGLTTNAFGLFTTFIGSLNNLNAVDWSSGPFFIEISIDPLNGNAYNSIGIQQFMSVPYALYAEKAGNTAPTPTITINSPNSVTSPSAGIYSVTVASSSTYTAGNGIAINGGVITNTLPAVTPTLTGTGIVTVLSTSANAYNIDVETSTLSVTGNTISITPGNSQILPTYSLAAGNSNIILNQTGNNYTVTPVTPTLSVSGASLLGSYPSQTLTVPSSSTGLVQGNNIILNQSGNTYTVSAVSQTLTAGNPNIILSNSGNNYTITPVTPTLNVSGGSLLGSYPSQTLTIPSSSTTLVSGTNVTLNQSGNSYTVNAITPTLTAGSNVTITPVGASNIYTITAGVASYTGTPNNISVSGNTINLISTGVPAGAYGSNISNAVPSFSVDNFGRLVAASQYTPTISGDVIGSINTSTVSKLRGIPVSTVIPSTGQILQYSGTGWVPSSLTTDWNILGNTGTTAANFIGTADNSVFHIRTNNLERANFNTGNAFNLFMGDNSSPGIINMNGNISNSIKVIEIVTANNGSALNIGAGDSKTGASNAYGGTLNLVSGAATGNTGSTIDFATASPLSSGATRSNPDLKMRLTEAGQLLIGNTTGYDPNAKLIVANGHMQSLQTNGPAIVAIGGLINATLSTASTDVVGTVSITTPLAGLLSAGNYAKITFDKPYSSMPIVILTPTNSSAVGVGVYITGTTLTDFTIAFSQAAALLSTYTFNYIVLEGK